MTHIYMCMYALFLYVYFLLKQGTMEEKSYWMVCINIFENDMNILSSLLVYGNKQYD